MPNPKGNIATLRSYKSPWNHKQTRTIRVPIVLAEQILDYAREIDANLKISDSNVTVFTDDKKLLINDVESAIKDINEMIESAPNSTLTKARRLKLSKVLEMLNLLTEPEALTQSNKI